MSPPRRGGSPRTSGTRRASPSFTGRGCTCCHSQAAIGYSSRSRANQGLQQAAAATLVPRDVQALSAAAAAELVVRPRFARLIGLLRPSAVAVERQIAPQRVQGGGKGHESGEGA